MHTINFLRRLRSPVRIKKTNLACMAIATKGAVCFRMASTHHHSFSMEIEALVVRRITGLMPSQQFDAGQWPHISNITELADPEFYMPAPIDVLLGAEAWSQIVLDGTIPGGCDRPSAQRTSLGWVIFGRILPDNAQPSRCFMIEQSTVDDDYDNHPLSQALKRFWQLEEPVKTRFSSREEKECEEIFERTHRRTPDGRYIVRMPLKLPASALGDSRETALKRLLAMERRFMRDPMLKENYIAFMKEYQSLGHMVDAPAETSGLYYIPHHAVSSAKFRVVFDGSAKTTSGNSLNDIQMVGKRLQDDLLIILCRFRRSRIALTADVQKMYRQVLIPEDQWDLQRILWRDHPTDSVQEKQLCTVTYGNASAPHSAVIALQQCAHDYSSEYPTAAAVVLRDVYMDDFLTG